MGAWYWIGVALGLGVALGVLAAALLAGSRAALLAGVVAAALAGAALGFWLEEVGGAVAGALGGLLGATATGQVVTGTLGRGGTRGGTAALRAGGALVVAVLAFVPVLGYLLALLVVAPAARSRRAGGTRHAGLRILARD